MRIRLRPSDPTPFQVETDRLFLGIFPDPEVAKAISRLTYRLRIGHELKGKPQLPYRLHATVHHIGVRPGLDANDVALAKGVAGKVKMVPFRVEFNSVQSFSNGALVLRGDDGVVGLEMLQRQLGAVMEKAGLGEAPHHYTPHVTLLWDDHRVPDHPITPIGWWVREFVLVHSFLGRSRYEFLARFPLR